MQGIFRGVLVCILTHPFKKLSSDESILVLSISLLAFIGTAKVYRIDL